MQYFIAPALGFHELDTFEMIPSAFEGNKPLFEEETSKIVETLQAMDMQALQKTLSCSDILTEVNFERYKSFNEAKRVQALRFFDGIAYKTLDAASLNSSEYEFLASHLSILSGLYGCLSPVDLIAPYRLEMKTKVSVEGTKNLYQFWGDKLYSALSKNAQGIIVDLASKEYSKCIEPYLKEDDVYITCTYMVDKGKGLKVQSTAAKQARGHMVRWIAQNKIDTPSELMKFDVDNYSFDPALSKTEGNRLEFVFTKYVN